MRPRKPYLRKSAIVPQVPVVGEAIADISKFALFYVLFNGIQWLFLRDLKGSVSHAFASMTYRYLTSILALVHRGISTIMFKIVCCSLA